MKILVTAFDPFGGDKTNPALEAVALLPDRIGEAVIIKAEAPTVFGKSITAVMDAVEREQPKPDAVILVGQAGGRSGLTPERIAINIDDARIADNEGNQPIDTVIYEDGENAYFSTLPIKAMVKAIKASGLPASVSNSAGTFVCNHLMYGVLYHLQRSYPEIKAGFIHVPYLPSQVIDLPDQTPSMALCDIVMGLKAAIHAVTVHEKDICVSGGTEC